MALQAVLVQLYINMIFFRSLVICAFAAIVRCEDLINADDSGVLIPAETNKGEEFVQGDIFVGKNGAASNRNAIKDPQRQWTDGKVCIRFTSDCAASVKADVRAAISDIHNFTCIRFTEDSTGTVKPCIVVQSNSNEGCYSMLGRMYFWDKQTLQLHPDGCSGKGVAIHELMHALGFDHEQNREDRDKAITVIMDNVEDSSKDQFEMSENFDTMGYPYDCNSVMHYGKSYFTKNGKDTMVPKDPSACPFIGNRKGFTKYDLKKLRKYYKCTDPEPSILSANANGGCAFIDGATKFCNEGFANGKEHFCYGNADKCPKTCVCEHPVSQAFKNCAKTNNDQYSNCYELVAEWGKPEICADGSDLKDPCARSCKC